MSTLKFLQALFPDLEDGHCCEIRAIRNGHVKRYWPTSVDEIISVAGVLSAEYDVYFGPAARRGHVGTKGGVAYVSALWTDLDKTPDEAVRILAIFSLAPSAIVESGYHVHAYWFLREPYIINGPEDVAYIESRLRGLAQRLGADSCWDISHMLRLPSTFNHKHGERRPVRLGKHDL